MSMINMDTWRFAHDHAGKLWWKVGIGLLGPTMLIHIPFMEQVTIQWEF